MRTRRPARAHLALSARRVAANFTISPQAKEARIRQLWNDRPDDPAVVAAVPGLYRLNSGHNFENVIIAFYRQCELPDVKDWVQAVFGIDLVFFTTEQYSSKFQGKVVDRAADRGFFRELHSALRGTAIALFSARRIGRFHSS
jgi:hypothetical protein